MKKSAFVCIALLVCASPNRSLRAAGTQTALPLHYELQLNGSEAGFVVNPADASSTVTSSHGPEFTSNFWKWVTAGLAGLASNASQPIAILGLDDQNFVRETSDYLQCEVTECTLPILDQASNAGMQFRTTFRYSQGHNSTPAPYKVNLNNLQQKHWPAANFKITVDGIPEAKYITRIESLTIRAAPTQIAPLVVVLPSNHATPFQNWLDQAGQGGAAAKWATITLLDSSFTPYMSIQLGGLVVTQVTASSSGTETRVAMSVQSVQLAPTLSLIVQAAVNDATIARSAPAVAATPAADAALVPGAAPATVAPAKSTALAAAGASSELGPDNLPVWFPTAPLLSVNPAQLEDTDHAAWTFPINGVKGGEIQVTGRKWSASLYPPGRVEDWSWQGAAVWASVRSKLEAQGFNVVYLTGLDSGLIRATLRKGSGTTATYVYLVLAANDPYSNQVVIVNQVP